MAKFSRRDDEQVIGEFQVSVLIGGKKTAAKLIVTNQRLVVTTGGLSGITERSAFFAGFVGKALDLFKGGVSRVEYEIPRERFACVEADDKATVFRSDGDGYAQTSFAVLPDLLLNSDTPETWQQRMTAAWPLHNSRK
jgi:hypothetical protein